MTIPCAASASSPQGKGRMPEIRPSGSVEGVVGNHEPYSDLVRDGASEARRLAGHSAALSPAATIGYT
jgi:hypothetical protein